MEITRNWIGLAIVLAACTAFSQSGQQKEPSPAIEIATVRDSGVDVRLRSVWSYPVSVWVCDKPQRLDGLGFDLEWFTGKNWERLKPAEGTVSGDLPPKYLEISQGQTVSVPAEFSSAFLGIKRGMRLRIVVRAWRTESNVLGTAKPTSNDPLLLTSAPFVWMAKP